MKHVWFGALVVSLSLIIAACDCRLGGVPQVAADNQSPTVEFVSLDEDLSVRVGMAVTISYIDDDPDGVATTSLFADRDGDLTTPDDQVVIASGRPQQDGQTQVLTWNTEGVAAAPYTIIAVTTDGEFTATATALGTVEIICDTPVDLAYVTGIASASMDGINGNAIGSFADGSFVAAGGFNGSVSIADSQEVFTSAGNQDIYVARYNADGSLRWALSAGGSADDTARGVATFPDGSCVVTGWFQGTIDFGSGSVSNGQGSRDPFVVRLDAAGNALWTSFGSSGPSSRGQAITALPDGSCVITGDFEGNLTVQETTVSNVGGDEIYAARFDSEGSLMYLVRHGGQGGEVARTITGFPDGSVVIAGDFDGTTEIAGETLTATDEDAFITRLDANGSAVWARFGIGTSDQEARGAAAMPDGAVVVTGRFRDTVVFGPDDPDEVTLTSAGETDVFVMCLTATGEILWARRDGGPSEAEGFAVAAFPDGSFVVTGEMKNTATFGEGEPNETTFIARGNDDVFYAHYDITGMLLWACRDGGPSEDDGFDIATFDNGSFVVSVDSTPSTKIFGKGDPNETTIDDRVVLVKYTGAPVGSAGGPAGPTLAFARSDGGLFPADLAAFPDGSFMLVGSFAGTKTFGTGEANEVTFSEPRFNLDGSVARYNADGTLAWASHVTGPGNDQPIGVACLADASCVVVGAYVESVILGPGESNETTLTGSANSQTVFIARFNADGTLAWARDASRGGSVFPFGTAGYADGSVVVTGFFESTATFGIGDANETMLTSAGDRDIFVARYNLDGSLAWVRRDGGTDRDQNSAIASFADGSCVAVGITAGGAGAVFGAGEPNETTITDTSVVARYNADGTLAWAVRAGGLTQSAVESLADGSCIVTGIFTETAVFGPGEPNETTFTAIDTQDIFVARYNADGSLAWARHAGGPDQETANGIAISADGSFVVVGRFHDTVTFGNGEANETTVTSAGGQDSFVAGYNADGTLAWARQDGGTNNEGANDVAVFADGSFVTAGSFGDMATFGAGEPNETTLIQPDGFGYIARFDPN